jgi:Ca-activated chloride channel family protein
MKTQSIIVAASFSLLLACADQVAQEELDDSLVDVSQPLLEQSPQSKPKKHSPALPATANPQPPAEELQHQLRVRPATIAKHQQASTLLTTQAAGMAQRMIADSIHHPGYYPVPEDRENYQQRDDNPIKRVLEEPLSTFSVDVDTAGYSNVRRMLSREGRLPPADAVKAEEMINYFSYNYALPEPGEAPFSVNTAIAPAPWNADRYLLQVGLKGLQPPMEQRPAANLVFLVDVSGSMQSADKLGLVKKSLRLLVNKMTAEDSMSLVVYAGAAGTVLEPTSGKHKATILAAIDNLTAGGSTNGGAGIQLAYALAEQQFIKGGINRVIIASDGDMNVGTVNIEALKKLVIDKRSSGIALTTLGFGSGNYNDALMEQLADVGNGNAAYIDSLREANKVLVQEMQSTLLTIAKDVKIQVEFNPAVVAEYRLIGYQNRLLKREDFVNDKVDAGDIGAGHTVTALYELTLVDAKMLSIPASRYQPVGEAKTAYSNELAQVKLRYKQPDGERSTELKQQILRSDIQREMAAASSDLRFASAVAGFSELLRGGQYTGDWSYTELLSLANTARADDPHGYRGEFIGLVELAQTIAGQ